MIIWINGSFGVGKTTIAETLKTKIASSIMYDPEKIGEFLFNIMPEKKDDFQDYELWRILNFEILKNLSKSYHTIIVPMTITNKTYYDEIIGNLRNNNIVVKDFILTATKNKIIERLDKRENSTEWAYEQVDRCIDVFDKNFEGYKINTNNDTVEDISLKILDILKN
ncbi:MAG: AAA family ATPase [Bacilli bacterium]|nr:AAA family ATPase [Bacilli bacterium]